MYEVLHQHILLQVVLLGRGSHIPLKGALDKYNIIPQLFPKKLGFLLPIEVFGMGTDCMLSFTF